MTSLPAFWPLGGAKEGEMPAASKMPLGKKGWLVWLQLQSIGHLSKLLELVQKDGGICNRIELWKVPKDLAYLAPVLSRIGRGCPFEQVLFRDVLVTQL